MLSISSLVALSGALFSISSNAAGSSTFSPARPPSIPLAVKSPYLSAWQQAGKDGGNGGYLAGEWPSAWDGATLGWTGLIRVDGLPYTWMGAPMEAANGTAPVVNQVSFSYTSTKSIFTMHVNNQVSMTITFLSAIFPEDFKRQSFPYSYMNVDVASLDGKAHAVQLYSDISAEWISGNRNNIAQWDYGVVTSDTVQKRSAEPEPEPVPQEGSLAALEQEYASLIKDVTTFLTFGSQTGFQVPATVAHPPLAVPLISAYINPVATNLPASQVAPSAAAPTNPSPGGVAYHKVYRQTQQLFSEDGNECQTEYGEWFYMTNNVKNLTHQSAADHIARDQFIKNGYLTDTQDTNFRAISDDWPVFGLAVDLGSVKKSVSTLFGIALSQPQAIQFEATKNGVQTQNSLWTSYFGNEYDAIDFFYGDYSTAMSMSTSLDNQIATDSKAAGGDNYNILTSLAFRQTFAALEFTGTPNNILAFQKEISSDGNVNTVDMIFPSHPLFIYINPAILKMMLDPLFINQEAGNWPFQYSIHDVGAHYPNATGHSDGNAEAQPLEESGNMIIMTLAYAQRANDNAYLTKHYSILRQWNTYLIEEALIPQDQISTDDFAGSLANQTNLAIKGIIGIAAMAQIAERTGNTADAKNFTNIANDYITKWQVYGTAHDASPPHTTLGYGLNNTHGLLYNIFADKELGLNLVPQSVYDMQSNFYPTIFNDYGVPLDTRHTWTKGDWEMFCAAVANTATKNEFISHLANWVNVTPTNLPLTDLYDAVTGDYEHEGGPTFIARPAVGGYFSLLALNSAPT